MAINLDQILRELKNQNGKNWDEIRLLKNENEQLSRKIETYFPFANDPQAILRNKMYTVISSTNSGITTIDNDFMALSVVRMNDVYDSTWATASYTTANFINLYIGETPLFATNRVDPACIGIGIDQEYVFPVPFYIPAKTTIRLENTSTTSALRLALRGYEVNIAKIKDLKEYERLEPRLIGLRVNPGANTSSSSLAGPPDGKRYIITDIHTFLRYVVATDEVYAYDPTGNITGSVTYKDTTFYNTNVRLSLLGGSRDNPMDLRTYPYIIEHNQSVTFNIVNGSATTTYHAWLMLGGYIEKWDLKK